MSGIRFTDESKRDAVAQVVDRGYSIAEVSERLGISTKSLYTWKAQFSQPRKQHTKPEKTQDPTCSITSRCSTTQSASTLEMGCCHQQTSKDDNRSCKASKKLGAIQRRSSRGCPVTIFSDHRLPEAKP